MHPNFFGHTLQFYYFQFYYLGINEDDAKLSYEVALCITFLHLFFQLSLRHDRFVFRVNWKKRNNNKLNWKKTFFEVEDQVPNSVMKLHKYTFFNSDSNKTIVYHFLCLISNVLHFILQNKISTDVFLTKLFGIITNNFKLWFLCWRSQFSNLLKLL